MRARRSTTTVRAFGIFGALAAAAACKGAPARTPTITPAAAQTIRATRDGLALRGVAGDASVVYAAYASVSAPPPSVASAAPPAAVPSIVDARRGDTVLWSTPLSAIPGDVAIAGSLVIVASQARPGELRGDPAAVLHALDAATGKPRWERPLESTDWVVVSSLATMGSDVVVGGSFGGTLRIADKVVTSGGGSDGFVARISATGTLVWLIRTGGQLTDGVQGIAVDPSGTNIAIAGTFSITADVLGEPLKSHDEKSPYGDAFVAVLDGNGGRRWTASFGSRADDAIAGVAYDRSGRVVVAANIRDLVTLSGSALLPRGPGDGLVVWYGGDGELGHAVLVGGNDFDGLVGITTVGDIAIVGGFFSGDLALADRTFAAGGGDDAFVAALDPSGTVQTAWHVGGDGREEVTSLGAVPGGFIAGVAHTAAARVDDAPLASPSSPAGGAAIVVRGY